MVLFILAWRVVVGCRLSGVYWGVEENFVAGNVVKASQHDMAVTTSQMATLDALIVDLW